MEKVSRNTTSSNEMVTKPIIKMMLKVGIPTMIAQIINLLYNIVDKIYIGHIPEIGDLALTGVGLCSSLILIISAFASFVGNGGAPLAGNSLGKGDSKKAEKILGNGVTFLIIMSIILTVTFYFIQDPYLKMVGASNNTIIYAKEYLNIYLIGTLFVLFTLGLNTFLTAQNKSFIAMIAISSGALINLGLDPLFIFTFDLGVKGAAIATVISQAVSCSIILINLLKSNMMMKIKLSNMKLDKNIMLEMFQLGISPFVMSITESLIIITMGGQLLKYGDDNYVGSLTVLQSTMQLMATPLAGFTQGVTALLAFNFGAKENERVKKMFKYLLIILTSYTTIFAIFTMIFPSFFSYLFTDKPNLANISSQYMPLFMSGMLIFGIQRACQTTFVALKQAKISLFIALLRKVILLVPLAFIFPLFFGVTGVYLAEAVSDATCATICGIIFFIKFPKIIAKNV